MTSGLDQVSGDATRGKMPGRRVKPHIFINLAETYYMVAWVRPVIAGYYCDKGRYFPKSMEVI